MYTYNIKMIRSADDLRATSRNKNVIRNEMREILKAIEHQMLIINREGRNSVDFKIPKTSAIIITSCCHVQARSNNYQHLKSLSLDKVI